MTGPKLSIKLSIILFCAIIILDVETKMTEKELTHEQMLEIAEKREEENRKKLEQNLNEKTKTGNSK